MSDDFFSGDGRALSLSAIDAESDGSEDSDGEGNSCAKFPALLKPRAPRGAQGAHGNPSTGPQAGHGNPSTDAHRSPGPTADLLAAFGASDKPITDALLPPTPPRRREVIEIPDSPSPLRHRPAGDLVPARRRPHIRAGRSPHLESSILAAIIRVELSPTIRAAVAKATADAIFGIRDHDLAALGSQSEEDLYVRRRGTAAGLAMLSELAPTVPFAVRVDRADLYVGQFRAPPQLADVESQHLCLLCGLVLSHPVLHVYCFVCFRDHLNDSWDCPRPDCRATQFRPPFVAHQLEADIQNTYVGFMDFTVATMTWQDVRFPSPRYQNQDSKWSQSREIDKSVALEAVTATSNADELREKARVRMARRRTALTNDHEAQERAREKAREASRAFRQRNAERVAAKAQERRRRRVISFILKSMPVHTTSLTTRDIREREARLLSKYERY
ncbi:hypothetical protein C8F01DRAFT_1090097 [Mycena amicta]|nr:hypothetical protein C8F01DRAFT_1090097 [Mycena amicta]